MSPIYSAGTAQWISRDVGVSSIHPYIHTSIHTSNEMSVNHLANITRKEKHIAVYVTYSKCSGVEGPLCRIYVDTLEEMEYKICSNILFVYNYLRVRIFVI